MRKNIERLKARKAMREQANNNQSMGDMVKHLQVRCPCPRSPCVLRMPARAAHTHTGRGAGVQAQLDAQSTLLEETRQALKDHQKVVWRLLSPALPPCRRLPAGKGVWAGCCCRLPPIPAPLSTINYL